MRTLITCTLSIVLAHYAVLSAQSGATQNASGRVTAVTAESVSIQTSKEALTLAVDSSTKVIGKGARNLLILHLHQVFVLLAAKAGVAELGHVLPRVDQVQRHGRAFVEDAA